MHDSTLSITYQELIKLIHHGDQVPVFPPRIPKRLSRNSAVTLQWVSSSLQRPLVTWLKSTLVDTWLSCLSSGSSCLVGYWPTRTMINWLRWLVSRDEWWLILANKIVDGYRQSAVVDWQEWTGNARSTTNIISYLVHISIKYGTTSKRFVTGNRSAKHPGKGASSTYLAPPGNRFDRIEF